MEKILKLGHRQHHFKDTMQNISVHQSTIHKSLKKHGIHGSTARRKPLLSKQNIAALLPETTLTLRTNETKVGLFEKNIKPCA